MKVKSLLLIGFLFIYHYSNCQVSWEFSSVKKKGFLCKNIYVLILKAKIAHGWRIFSQDEPPYKPAHTKTKISLVSSDAIKFSVSDPSAPAPMGGRPIPGFSPTRNNTTIVTTALFPIFKEIGENHSRVYRDGERDFFYIDSVLFKKQIKLRHKYKDAIVSGTIEATVARVSNEKYLDKSKEDLYTDKVPFAVTIKRIQ